MKLGANCEVEAWQELLEPLGTHPTRAQCEEAAVKKTTSLNCPGVAYTVAQFLDGTCG